MLAYQVRDFAHPLDDSHATRALKGTVQQFGLVMTRDDDTTMRHHWHFRRPNTSGTLEVTWNQARQFFIVSVHANREGANAWARLDCPRFAQSLAQTLNGRAAPAQQG